MKLKKLFILIISVFTIAAMTLLICYADNEITITQAYVNTNYIDVFIPESMNSDSLSLKISNQDASLIDGGYITDKNVSVYTTILLDISTSMPSETRDKTMEFINYLIANIATNEKYRIAAFGEKLTVLQDFTSDRYDLSNSVNEIEFNAKQTMVYDAIYNTMPKVQPINGEPCYYRTIVITDGGDVTSSGVTKEELYLKLQANTYPVDVVDVSKTKQSSEKKDLSALTRISMGKYTNIYPEADISAIADTLGVGNIFWCRAEVPALLLDGSTRQVNISDGINDIQFDIKVSVYDAVITNITDNNENTESTDKPEETELTGKLEASESAYKPEESESTDSMSENQMLTILVIVGAVILILVVVVILVIISRKKKPNEPERSVQVQPIPIANNSSNEKTEFIENTNSQFVIKISSVKKSNESWTLPLDGELFIGRAEHCTIRLEDKSVSREQCKIVVRGNAPVVVNLSSTNKTLLNDVNVPESSALQAGDIIKFGRESLRIDYIQSQGEMPSYDKKETVLERSDTESMF